jgi:hypothetical protein
MYVLVHVQTKPGVNLTEDDVVVHATRIDFTRGLENPVSTRYTIILAFLYYYCRINGARSS